MKNFLLIAGLVIGLFGWNIQETFAQAVTGVTLDKHTLNLRLYDSYKLTATISPSNAANQKVTWTSSYPNLISVDQAGNVSAGHDGIATITVKTADGNFTDSCVVNTRVDNAANINDFVFAGESHKASILDNSHIVIGFLPYGTDSTNLTVSSYQISPGATIVPLPETIHNFSDTVAFVVTAKDGTQLTWKVTTVNMADVSNTKKFEVTFSTAPKGWIDDTVSWVENNINFHISFPDSMDTTSVPYAEVTIDRFGNRNIGLFPAKMSMSSEKAGLIIVAAEVTILENCGSGCTKVIFHGQTGSSTFDVPPSQVGHYYFNLSGRKVNNIELASFESQFSEITLWLANADGNVNRRPVAWAGSEISIQVNEGDTVRVPGTSSYDPDGDSLSFHWTVQPGWGIVLVDSTQPEVKFKAPMVDNDTVVKIVLRVDDGILFSVPDTATVIVKNVNRRPVAWAGSEISIQVNEGDTVRVPGTSSYDPDGDSLSFHWTVQPGWGIVLVDSTQPEVKFKAPMVDNDTVVKIVLRVDDGILFSVPDTATVIVKNVNTVPVADAGKDFNVLSGKPGQLNGSNSYDPDDESLSYTWTAPAGIQLDDAHIVSPVFTAPHVTSELSIFFTLTVSDGQLTSEVDTVRVTIMPIRAVLSISALVNDTTIPYRQRHITLYYHNDKGRWEISNIMSYNENGETYYAVWEGEWLATVDPVGSKAGFVTTFYGDVTQWANANAINVAGGSQTHVVINCVPVSKDISGVGMIDGQIFRDTLTAGVSRNTIVRFDGRTGKNLVPAKGVSIFLYRSSDKALLASALTDANGEFVFNNLPVGGYYLLVQLPGFDPNTPITVGVTDENTEVSDVNFVINEADQSVTDVRNPEQISVRFYPNPAKDQLYIQIADKDVGAVMRIYDLTGHLVMTGNLENRTTQIDIRNLRNGTYLLRIDSRNKIVTYKIIKQ